MARASAGVMRDWARTSVKGMDQSNVIAQAMIFSVVIVMSMCLLSDNCSRYGNRNENWRLPVHFGLSLGVDFVALSFVQQPSDVHACPDDVIAGLERR